MDKNKAGKIIAYAMQQTAWRREQYVHSWSDLDVDFLKWAWAQGGFESFKFASVLEEAGIFSAVTLGSILENYQGAAKYDRAFAGSMASPFYKGLRSGARGQAGREFYLSVGRFLDEGLGQSGRIFWRLMWEMLLCCRQLCRNHQGGYRQFLVEKFSQFTRTRPSEAEFLNMSIQDWEAFKYRKSPWRELIGLDEDIFDHVIADVPEAKFGRSIFPVDVVVRYFLRITGISRLFQDLEPRAVLRFLWDLNLRVAARDIYNGIYAYSSVQESEHFGFCRDVEKCRLCGVFNICDKRFNEIGEVVSGDQKRIGRKIKLAGNRLTGRAMEQFMDVPPEEDDEANEGRSSLVAGLGQTPIGEEAEPAGRPVLIDEGRASVDGLFSGAIQYVRKMFFQFHAGLEQFNAELHEAGRGKIVARAHTRGVTYLVDGRKAFVFLDVQRETLSFRFPAKGEDAWPAPGAADDPNRLKAEHMGEINKALKLSRESYRNRLFEMREVAVHGEQDHQSMFAVPAV